MKKAILSKIAVCVCAAFVIMRGPVILDEKVSCLSCNLQHKNTNLLFFEINLNNPIPVEIESSDMGYINLILDKDKLNGIGCYITFSQNSSQGIFVGTIEANLPHELPNESIIAANFCTRCRVKVKQALINPLYDILLIDTVEKNIYGFDSHQSELKIREYNVKMRPEDNGNIRVKIENTRVCKE